MSVTQDDVAAKAGVSRALVSLVMRNSPRVSAPKREAVWRAASDLGYRPNTHAAQLASRRAMILGIVLPEVQNPVFPQILKAAEDQAEEAGYSVLVTVGDMDLEQERRAVNRLLGHRVDGLVLTGTKLPSKEVQELARQVPLVAAGRRVKGVDVVSVDDRAGARLAVQHLIDLGHHNIAHIDGGHGPGAQIRRRAYTETMKTHGLAEFVRVATGDYSESAGMTASETLLTDDHPPTAIFAANDLSAVGVLAVAKRLGRHVPADLSVVGFDNTPLSRLNYIDLTTVSQPGDETGSTAIKKLVARVADPQREPGTTLLTPELHARGTTTSLVDG